MDATTDPYDKTCKWEYCRKRFRANRLNQEYCTPDHKSKANNWKQRLVRLKTKNDINPMYANEKILQSFYETKKFIVTKEQLQEAKFNFNASNQMMTDKRNGQITYRYFVYGYQAVDSNNLKVLSFGNASIQQPK